MSERRTDLSWLTTFLLHILEYGETPQLKWGRGGGDLWTKREEDVITMLDRERQRLVNVCSS
ncbi:hypothetical protein PLICRDRAFT_47553 [Plicaturopsis crispa FD-325 SS-3]|nr:hypothetical protein PLICRDRAFT_47553 [Plicaturopsis crispa FD-325 SS-3]